MTSVCLTMIVKDEAHVIGRCLVALKPYIDHAVIIDTGSTDNTIDIIKEILPDAKIGHSEFISFRHNRTELLEKAREAYPDADFHLMIDADDTWAPGPEFEWPELKKDAYHIEHRLGELAWWRPQVFRANKPFHYSGVAHEALDCDETFMSERLYGVRIQCGSDGARRLREPTRKYEKVAAQLQADHEGDPANARTVFYLAQSYRDCRQREKALHYYELRAMMGGWDEEVWYSLYQIGRLRETLNFSVDEVLNAYTNAFVTRPSRSEPMVAAAFLCRRTRQRALQFMYAATAIHIPYPESDRLFVEWTTYDWKAWDEFAMACWHQRRFRDCLWANYQILCNSEALTGALEERIIGNISHCSLPGDKLEPLKVLWHKFRALQKHERVVESVFQLFAEAPELREIGDYVELAIECGGGFPK